MFYKEIPAYMLSKHINFKDKVVLEIGGGAKLEAAKKFLELGAKHVTVTNIGHGIENAEKHENILTMYADALHLNETFDGFFDIIFGVAILEHIPNPEIYLKQIYDLLNPGGYVCLTGGPIWTGPLGHHLWAKGEHAQYRFADPLCNPVTDWGHLILTEDEMYSDLTQNMNIPKTDAEEIVKWIYYTTNINRITQFNLKKSFYNSEFDIIEYQENKKNISSDLEKILRAKHGSENDYSVFGIKVVLKK